MATSEKRKASAMGKSRGKITCSDHRAVSKVTNLCAVRLLVIFLTQGSPGGWNPLVLHQNFALLCPPVVCRETLRALPSLTLSVMEDKHSPREIIFQKRSDMLKKAHQPLYLVLQKPFWHKKHIYRLSCAESSS